MYVGRILVGWGGGMGAVVGPTYVAEVAPKQIRGAIGIVCECGGLKRLTQDVISADSGEVASGNANRRNSDGLLLEWVLYIAH